MQSSGTPAHRRRRFVAIIAGWLFLAVAPLNVVGAASAETEHTAHTDLEFRLGFGTLCGTCDDHEATIGRVRETAQVFADRLFDLAKIGPGSLEIGPYVKGALLDGLEVPQVAGGLALGYRIGNYEALVNGGFGYATERIGQSHAESGQTRHTYDLGMTLRYDIAQYFLSVGYQHNSNGSSLGINFIHEQGANPGYDNVFVGVGTRF